METTRKTASPGTVSWGTMREEDLIPTFLGLIESLDPARAEELKSDWRNGLPGEAMDPSSWHAFEDAQNNAESDWTWEMISIFLNETLWDAMDDYAPPGTSFTSHPGDGADYGYWEPEDTGTWDIDPCLDLETDPNESRIVADDDR